MKLIKLWHISYLILIILFLSSFSANGQNKRRQTQPIGKTLTQTHRDGNEIEEVRRASEGTVIKIVTKYDEESKMLGKLEYRNGALWVTSKYTYEFDGYGNWVKRLFKFQKDF